MKGRSCGSSVGVRAGRDVRVRSPAPRRAGPSGVLPSPGGHSDPPGTCLFRLVGRWIGLDSSSCPFLGRACPHPRPQGTKADLRAGSAPVTDEPPASHCSPSPAVMGGCSREAGQVELEGSRMPGRPPVVPGSSWSKAFLPELFVGEPGPRCHQLPKLTVPPRGDSTSWPRGRQLPPGV